MNQLIVSEEAIINEIIELSGSNPNSCYQCGKCSGGCPVNFAMDFSPSAILRLLQVGKSNTVLASNTIWLCTGCEACSTRCPRNIDLPKIMDCLKQIAVRHGYINNTQAAFHQAFLNSIRSRGRFYGAGLALNPRFLARTKGVRFSVPIALKAKIRLLPSSVRNKKQIDGIFSASFNRREGWGNE